MCETRHPDIVHSYTETEQFKAKFSSRSREARIVIGSHGRTGRLPKRETNTVTVTVTVTRRGRGLTRDLCNRNFSLMSRNFNEYLP